MKVRTLANILIANFFIVAKVAKLEIIQLL